MFRVSFVDDAAAAVHYEGDDDKADDDWLIDWLWDELCCNQIMGGNNKRGGHHDEAREKDTEDHRIEPLIVSSVSLSERRIN